jgi:hypothetical protein
MATEQQTAVTKAELDESLETNFSDMKGYVDTAVDTLTEEMDRQFKELSTKLDTKFTEVLTAIREHQHGL